MNLFKSVNPKYFVLLLLCILPAILSRPIDEDQLDPSLMSQISESLLKRMVEKEVISLLKELNLERLMNDVSIPRELIERFSASKRQFDGNMVRYG